MPVRSIVAGAASAASWSEIWTAAAADIAAAPFLRSPKPVSDIMRFRRQQQRKKRMREMTFAYEDRQAPALFDREHLAAQTMRDRRLQIEMIELYFRDAPSALQSMRDGLAKGDPKAWEAGAHKLKNMGGTLGLMRLFEIAKEANDSIRADRDALCPRRLRALDDALCAAQAAAFAFKAQLSAQLAVECGAAERQDAAPRRERAPSAPPAPRKHRMVELARERW